MERANEAIRQFREKRMGSDVPRVGGGFRVLPSTRSEDSVETQAPDTKAKGKKGKDDA